LGPERRGTVPAALCLAGSAAVSWLLTAGLTTGSAFPDYLEGTREILATASSLGLGQFEFYWTLHSLSLFALLTAGIVAVGSGLFRIFREPMSEGDRLLLGALAFVTVGLKAALQRADVWHLGAPFVVLVAAFLLSPPRRLFALGTTGSRVVVGLITVAGLAQLIGLAPTASYFAGGVARGALDALNGRPAAGPIDSRMYSVESELTTPREEVVELAAFLAAPERAARPVFFYGDRWALGYHVGVCPSGYSFYDLLYSDAKAPMRTFLTENPDAYVIMGSDAYQRLFEGASAPGTERHLSITKRLGAWLSTVHHLQTPIEREAKYHLWKRELGAALAENWVRVAQFGEEVVLAKRDHANIESGEI
jgi:hypothetical protein